MGAEGKSLASRWSKHRGSWKLGCEERPRRCQASPLPSIQELLLSRHPLNPQPCQRAVGRYVVARSGLPGPSAAPSWARERWSWGSSPVRPQPERFLLRVPGWVAFALFPSPEDVTRTVRSHWGPLLPANGDRSWMLSGTFRLEGRRLLLPSPIPATGTFRAR